MPNHYQDYMMMQQQHLPPGMEPRQMESQMHAEQIYRMQPQHQEQPMHVPPPHLQQPPVPQYQPTVSINGLTVITNPAPPMNMPKRNYYNKPVYVGGMTKNNSGKRQNNSPTHLKQGPQLTNSSQVPASQQLKDGHNENLPKPKSPVKVFNLLKILFSIALQKTWVQTKIISKLLYILQSFIF